MIRIVLFLFTISVFSCKVVSQPPKKLVYINDFGAIANDNKSDQAAFNAAATFINKNKGNVELVIGPGKYLVGPEYDYEYSIDKIPLSKQWNVLDIIDCSNVKITGKPGTNISFRDNIPFGAVPYLKNGSDSSVHIGSLLRFTNCTDVIIENINGDGNNDRFRLLKNWGEGANPYEREHEGLFILNCQRVSVKNCRFDYFGRDGLMILSDSDKLPVKDLSFTDCSFNYNGRDGVSWCGGENVLFINCEFQYNATGKIVTNPASGLDIEPERGADCKNGSFINCVFANNGGYGVVSMYENAINVSFTNCTIKGTSAYAAIINSPQLQFKETLFYGTSLFNYDASDIINGTKIIGCSFTDSLKDEQIFTEHYLVALKGRYTRVDKTSFISYKVPSVYTEIKKKNSAEDKENIIFDHCIFDARFKKNATWGKLGFLVSHSKFINSEFKGNGFADFTSVVNQREKNIYLDKTNKIYK